LASELLDVTIDFGAVKTIGAVKILWEAAFAKRYELAISTDGTTWTSVFTGEGSAGPTLANFAPRGGTLPPRHRHATGHRLRVLDLGIGSLRLREIAAGGGLFEIPDSSLA
jgi:hypothetical protein